MLANKKEEAVEHQKILDANREEEKKEEPEMNKSINSKDDEKDEEEKPEGEAGEDGEEKKEEKEESEEDDKEEKVEGFVAPIIVETFAVHTWKAKVARFMAYAINGGLFQSQMTIELLLKMSASIADAIEERIISREICYLCHIRKKGKEYERIDSQSFDQQLKLLMQNFHNF